MTFYENETKFDKLFPNLIFGKNSKNMNFRVRRESETLGAGGDDAGDEGPVAQLVVQRLLVRPVGSFANLPEMRMIFWQTWKRFKEMIGSTNFELIFYKITTI